MASITYSNTLMEAVEKGNLAKVKELVENGVDVNAIDYRGDIALIIASENGYTDIVEFLKSVGAKE